MIAIILDVLEETEALTEYDFQNNILYLLSCLSHKCAEIEGTGIFIGDVLLKKKNLLKRVEICYFPQKKRNFILKSQERKKCLLFS